LSDASAIASRLAAVFTEGLNVEAPHPDTDLIESGILDSFQFVELLLQLERHFGFRMKIEDIDLEDLRSLARIARLVAAHTDAEAPIAPR
jgi:methoxymalonate biosynthesis acyl carrier protein